MAKYSEVIEGLEILARHSEGGRDSYGIGAEHDVIYGGGSDIGGEDDIPEEDRGRLEALGWFWDEEVDSWAHFT